MSARRTLSRLVPRALKAALREAWSWTNPFRHVLGTLRASLATAVGGLQLSPGARVLDYGCGGHPYRSLFPGDCDYVGADLPGNPAAALTIDEGGRVPAANASFDVVVSTQVLEHVADPALYLGECHRLLKPAGTLLLTTHGLMFYHPFPQDLWRWTADGLELILQRAGFTIVGIRGIVGLVPTSIWLVMFNSQGALPWGLRHIYVLACNLLMAVTDRLTSAESKSRNANVYTLVARKDARSPG